MPYCPLLPLRASCLESFPFVLQNIKPHVRAGNFVVCSFEPNDSKYCDQIPPVAKVFVNIFLVAAPIVTCITLLLLKC